MIYIYHHADDDGYASAATVITYLIMSKTISCWDDSRLSLIKFNYDCTDTFIPYPENGFKDNDDVYLVDISVSTNTLKNFVQLLNTLRNNNCKFTWIDHHKSSVNEVFYSTLSKLFEINEFEKYIDTSYCAAYNCYKYLINGKLGVNVIPEIIRIIDDYDCWKLKLEHTKEFIVGFSLEDLHNPHNPNWYKWLTVRGDSISIIRDCINNGITVNKWLDIDDTNKYNSYSFETTLCGFKCCALNVRRNSDIFRMKNKDDYDVLLSYIYNGNEFIYSIYSTNPNVYCNKIAELFGGGGHPGAAGFRSKKLVVNKNVNWKYKLKDNNRKSRYNKLTNKKIQKE